MNSVFLKIFHKIPNSIQFQLNTAYSKFPIQLRLGPAFWNTYSFLQKSQWWSKEVLEQYQMSQLRILLNHSYANVPYYRKTFDSIGLKPQHIHNLDDLSKVPLLTKDVFKLNYNEMVARNFDLTNLIKSNTSGTSGKPLQFYQEISENEKEWAFICHQWSRVGYKPGDPRVELRGKVIHGENRAILNPYSNVLRLSPLIENPLIAKYYLKKIKAFNSSFLHGYPSAIASFAFTIKKYDLKVPFRLKAVFFTSELVYEWQKVIVQEVFGCRTFSHYGMSEHVATAAECEQSAHYHFIPQYGITEIDPITNEIIATSFLNNINPFIRYRTTDTVSTPFRSKCNCCTRNYFPIVEDIQGRIEDYIITPEGTLISPAIITHPFKNLRTVKDTQLIQESATQLILRVVLWDRIISKDSATELRQLSMGLQEILGVNIQIKTEIVNELKRLKSGKFKWILSEVSKGLIERGLD